MYSGIKGKPLLGTTRSLLHGQAPSTAPSTNTLTPAGGGTTGPVQDLPFSSIVAGGNYSSAQVENLWRANGGSAATASVAACIAMHESSGSPTVTSTNPDGGTNVGIWQLDTLGVGSGHSVAQLQDPNTNARLAIGGSRNGTNWAADWSTAASCGA
jgi:Lysozyme like domain